MRAKKIVVINGHPDPSGARFVAALAAAYLTGASEAGHAIRRIDVGELNLPAIHSMGEFTAEASPGAKAAQEAIAWADHVVVLYPLWLGGPPAVLKAFFEQVFRYGFALGGEGPGLKGLLKGRSARVFVTMGMPGPIFRLVFDAPGLKAVTRGILMICGLRPVRSTVIGMVDASPRRRETMLRKARRLGAAAS